jgi:hypothetical protein
MSTVASSSNKQSGTASAVSGGAHPAPRIHSTGIQDATSHIPTTPITQPVGAENADNDNDDDSDLDSLFGEDDSLDVVWAGLSMDGGNDTPPSKDNAHSHNERSGSDRYKNQVAAADLTFPTIDPNYDCGASTQANSALHNDTTAHEEFPKNSSISNALSTATQYHEAMSKLVASQLAAETSGIDALLPPSDNGNASNRSDEPSSNVSTANSDQDNVFGALSNGSIPKASMSSAILFGPDLQKALFTDGEASSDPQLPAFGGSVHVPSGPILQAENGTQLGQAVSIAEEEIIAPASPQRPPATPPRLVNIPISRPSSRNPHEAAGARGANHNPSPDKPNTPLADQLRSDFWNWHCKDSQLLRAYRQSYKTWFEFTTKDANKTQADYEQKASTHKSHAISNQLAWVKHSRSFDQWKAENPAAMPIINNITEEMKLIKAGEKLKAERADLENELRGKPEKDRKSELDRYDDFMALIKQSRERELWRGRVEAQKAAQRMIEAKIQAAVDEQEGIAAEEERRKAEVEAAEHARLESVRLEKARLEQERREQERLATEAAQRERIAIEAAEQDRLASEAAVLERAQQEAMNQDVFALAAPENTGSGDVQDFQF